MTKYSLNISFEQADLQLIYKANLKVVLAKQNHSGRKLTWVTLQPFQYNTIEWSDSYSIYCSNADLESGIKIHRLSDIAATPAMQYTFKDGYFSIAPDNLFHLQDNTYYVRNEMSSMDSLTFGLAQGVIVNGKNNVINPINAMNVPFMQSITFTPHEVIQVYLESDCDDSVVVDNANNRCLTLAFGEEAWSANIRYSKSNGSFYAV